MKYLYLVWFQQEKAPAEIIPIREYFMYMADSEVVYTKLNQTFKYKKCLKTVDTSGTVSLLKI